MSSCALGGDIATRLLPHRAETP